VRQLSPPRGDRLLLRGSLGEDRVVSASGIVALLLVVVLAACTSPESSRQRSGGPGADVGNRHREGVELHEGANPYWRAPGRLGKGRAAPTETARQAEGSQRAALRGR